MRLPTIVALSLAIGHLTIGTGDLSASPADALAAGGVALRMTVGQPGSPLTLLSTTNDYNRGAFVDVEVRNDSALHVAAVTFGIMIHHSNDPSSQPVWRVGRQHAASIPTGGTYTFTPSLMHASEMMGLVSTYPQGAVVELGVVGVRFTDGSAYRSDARSRGRFGPRPIIVRAQVGECSGAYPPLSDGEPFMQVWKCQDLSAPIYCQNTQSQCKEILCPDPENCAEQECVVKEVFDLPSR
jgi:hypothetical protein